MHQIKQMNDNFFDQLTKQDKKINDRLSLLMQKYDFVTEELKDYDDYNVERIREEINFHVINLTKAIEGEDAEPPEFIPS